MKEVLCTLGPADTIFQKQEMSYRRAMPIIDAVKSTIGDNRNEEEFEKYLKQSDELIADSLGAFVRPARVGNRRRSRSTLLTGFTIEETIGERSDEMDEIKAIYYEIIDVTLSEFKERFSENNEILLALSSSAEMDLAQLKPLEKLGIELPPEHELKTAKTFIEAKKAEWEKEMAKKDENERTSFNILSTLFEYRLILPKVYKLYAAVETFACSTAICEASFSALARINISSRLSMTNKRMRNLSFLAFEHKRLKKIAIDRVLKQFNDKKDRRVQLF